MGEPTSLAKTVLDLDLSAKFFIITHGGCPDGQAAAYIMHQALISLKSDVDVEIIQGNHGKRVTPEDLVVDSAILLFVDICPVEADAPCIEAARQVFVMDHHPTEPADIAPLKKVFGDKIVDLSVTDSALGECGASVVQKFCSETYSLNPDLLQLFWKLDVFTHRLPERLEHMLPSFKGWINQNGSMKCTQELVEALVLDMDETLKKGEVFYRPVRENTLNYIKGAKVIYSSEFMTLYMVDVNDLAARKLVRLEVERDLMIYQTEIDKLKQDGVAIGFFTVDRHVDPKSGVWRLGMRRAGVHMDMGKVAAQLRDSSDHFVGGGGHPYAAAAQCKTADLDNSILIASLISACQSVVQEGTPFVESAGTGAEGQTMSAERIKSCFRQVDATGDGVVDKCKMINFLLSLDENAWTVKDLERLLDAYMRLSSNSCIDFSEFVDWIFDRSQESNFDAARVRELLAKTGGGS